MDYRALRTRRHDYTQAELDEKDLAETPLKMFELWFGQATEAELLEPNAMSLSTVDATGRPSCRIVLMRSIDEEGLRFYTNFESRKGRDLAANPAVACTFFWPDLERQVRVEGDAERLPDAVSDDYYHSRPRPSQLSAWASPQSDELGSRMELSDRLQAAEERFRGQEVLPRPPFWGGYLVRPHRSEFWQGRPSRRHDRFRYRKAANGWSLSRLAP